MPPQSLLGALIIVCVVCGISAKIGGWDDSPNTQYHIQTDEGPERYFKYQTVSGQYRKEKRLQDGTVIGSYGWVDANGFLRLKDYIADDKGYRIVRTKLIRVGLDTPISNAVDTSTITTARPEFLPKKPVAPISLDDYIKEKSKHTPVVEINNNGYPTSTPAPFSLTTEATNEYIRPVTFRPYYNPNMFDKNYNSIGAYKYEKNENVAQLDGVSLTHNGFRYYLPKHYHEEETLPGDKRAGSFGYIDPFGIRRVIYYNTSPGSGFVHRKNNKYVGFDSTPYDPRF